MCESLCFCEEVCVVDNKCLLHSFKGAHRSLPSDWLYDNEIQEKSQRSKWLEDGDFCFPLLLKQFFLLKLLDSNGKSKKVGEEYYSSSLMELQHVNLLN